MFGPFLGAACAIGLGILFVRRHRRWHGRGHGHHGYGGPHGRRAWRRYGLRYVLERLDTTPGQEKVILGAIDDLQDRAKAAREGLHETRESAAAQLRGDQLDVHAFAGLFDGHVARLETLRDDAAHAVATIHEALTPKQRARLADLLESSRHFRPHYAL